MGNKTIVNAFVTVMCLFTSLTAHSGDTVAEYLREFPNQEQVKMMDEWLTSNQPGEFIFTGLVDPTDTTVVTPQATVDYGYNWFSLSEGPAIITTPEYDKFFSISIFDMKHNVPAVVANPDKPILLMRPGQSIPDGDFTIIELETDQGLALTRTVVVDNMDEVSALREHIVMEGGNGDMTREVEAFPEATASMAHAVMDALFPIINPDDVFGKVSGDVDFLLLATAVKYGQLGTPSETVRYAIIATDSAGQPLKGDETYSVTIPAGLVEESGYYSMTLYGTDNKLLIPNDQEIYDRSTYSSEPNSDGTYTLVFSPSGEGKNGIPTGKDFYGVLRAYVPSPNAVMAAEITKQ